MNARVLRFLLVFLVLFLAASVPAWAQKSQTRTMDKILCSIGNNIITLEQIEVERAILAKAGDSLLFPGEEARLSVKQVFVELVARRLLLNTAVRMGFSKIDPKVVEKSLADFRGKVGGTKEYLAFLARYQMKDASLPEDIKQSEFAGRINYRFRSVAIVKHFVAKKLELQVRLALENAYAEARDKLSLEHPGKSDEELKKIFEESLSKKKLIAWIREIAGREKITVLDEGYRDDLQELLGLKENK